MQKTVVIGAAGTGKTYLLIESVTRLLDEEELGASGGKILVLTSSPHAAGDIRSRLRGVHPDCYADVVIHTVRSLCEAVLKDSDPEIQILSDFGTWFILRERIRADSVPMRSSYIRVKDKRSFIREMLELMEATSVNSISMDQLPPVPDEANVDQAAGKLEDIKGIYKYHKDYCERHNLTPAFDVIPRASDLLSEYGEQFSHIFIDQCEDLCLGEVQAINLLSGDHANVTIFVDAVRCDPGMPDAGCWMPDAIIRYPASGIQHGRVSADMGRHVNRLLRKTAYPETDGQDARAPGNNDQTLIIGVEETAVDEAEYIARTIKREHDRLGRKYADFAILCREVETLGGSIRDALKKYSIPYSGGVDVSQDPMVRFVLLCLQVVAEPHEDDIALKWLSSPIARLDRADVYRAYAHARKKKQELLQMAAEQASLEVGARRAVPLLHKSGGRLKKLLSIRDFVISELRSGRNIWELVSPILVRTGAMEEEVPRAVMLFIEMIRDIEATYEERPALPVILNDIKLGLIQISNPDCSYICEDNDAVRIMSIWESRGLESPFVFVPGMVGNFFPARHPARQLLYGEDLGIIRAALRGIDLPGTISPDRWQEQERQLLYIAMTRAKEKVYLTLAHQYPENEDCEPSRFLTDLLGGKEISVDNCAHYNILYQDRTVSISPDGLPSLDDVTSRGDLEIAYCRYIRELEQFDHQKAEEIVKILSNMRAVGDMLPPAPLKEVAIPQSPSQRFSHTYIRSFLSCPRRYFLAHLLKLEADYGPGARFGGLVHDVLKEFHKQYPRLCDYDLEELREDMRKILSDAWDDKVEAEFAGNRLQAQSYLRLAGEVLRAYLQAEHGRWEEDRSCIRTENDFGFLFLDKYNLTGRIDRIDACAPGDEIIDFKTSTRDDEGETALKSKFLNMDDDPNYQPQDYQLPIYYLAGLNDRGLRPERLVVYQLRNLSRRSGEPFRRELEILPDEDARSGKKDKFLTRADLESVKDDILQTLERMMSGIYPPEPREDRVCEGECEFSFLCDREENDSQ
jgi:DNA helicase-2/ATP-dependent DNA helicase PcrA